MFINLQLFAHDVIDLQPLEPVDEVITEAPDSKEKDEECNCPPVEAKEEKAPTVFLIRPEPKPEVPVQKEEEYIPGYVEKLQRGYSDESYKQIIRD